MRNPLSLYFHWPYCRSICSYCDFNRVVEKNVNNLKLQQTFIEEIRHFFNEKANQKNNYTIDTIFFGGGTPSLMPPNLMKAVLDEVKSYGSKEDYQISSNIEISMEANPTSIEMEKMQDFKAAGVNRLSIGVQSFFKDDLKFLGRQHSPEEAKQAIQTAINVFGANSLSIDLIYGLPSHVTSKDLWRSTLAEAFSFKLGHLSCYQLTLERKTKLYREYNTLPSSGSRRSFELPNDEESLELFRNTQMMCRENGLKQYEVSNYSRAPPLRCRHNVGYWTSNDYIGFGPGAASRISTFHHSDIFHNNFLQRESFLQHPDPQKWMELPAGEKNVKSELLTENQTLTEILMMGLRMNDGLRNDIFKRFFNGRSYQELLSKRNLEKLCDEQLLDLSDANIIRATSRGMEVLDSVIKYILS